MFIEWKCSKIIISVKTGMAQKYNIQILCLLTTFVLKPENQFDVMLGIILPKPLFNFSFY